MSGSSSCDLPVAGDATAPAPRPWPVTSGGIDAAAFQDMIDAIEFAIYVYGRDGRLCLANEAAYARYQSLGVERPRVLGHTRRDFHQLLLNSGYIDQAQFALLSENHARHDLIEMAAGRSVMVRRFPIASGGEVVIVIDVSEIRRTEQMHAAEQRLTTIGSLVAGIANEISSPLGVAVTAASRLRDAVARTQAAMQDGAITAEQFERAFADFADATALVLSNLDRSAELVQNLKLLAAEPAGDLRQRISIRRQLNGIVDALGSEATRRGHRLLADCETDAEVETCPGALSQVVANLVMNSLHHAFDDQPGGTVLVSATRHDGQVRIVVGDDGVGLEPEVQSRIFDPFYTTRRGQGVRGLGLAIVHNLVTRRLGGLIKTEGAPGEGLRQIVTIPVHG